MLALRNAVLQRDRGVALCRHKQRASGVSAAASSRTRNVLDRLSHGGGNDAERAVALAVDTNVVGAVLQRANTKRQNQRRRFVRQSLAEEMWMFSPGRGTPWPRSRAR
jgi:hypothetical protein